ncbi:interferon alpha/beta receptor 2-like isoform X2 [Takifugu flavidus]|uniref:interferon alpha/beta receptor 2-like isoform X2 n=1 Tax=Takifugu flavidus TaxID=433684 RepID=UPI002544B4D3|nr:interferon alpha/beta receptor 2-like isoform X2 [Takifugu flavidus]
MWMILLHLQLAAGVSLPAPTNLSITSFNMEHTLSFLPGPLTPPSCRFAVETLHPRRKRLWTPVAGCSRLKAGRTCNLTRAFEDPFDQYQARVRGFVSNLTSRWTVSKWFQPLTDTVLGPPDVSVSGCGNCLLLQFNTSSDWRLRKMIGFYRELVVVVRRSRDGAQFSLNLRYQDNMVVTYLQPGVEYCVTVSMKSFFKSTSVASEPHCAFTSRPQHATTLYVACALVGAFCSLVLFLVGRVVCGSRLSSTLLKTLKSLVTMLFQPGGQDHGHVSPELWGHSSTMQRNPHTSNHSVSDDSCVNKLKLKVPLPGLK